MQTFYDQLVPQGETRGSEKSWLAQLNQLTLEQVAVIRESALAWDPWSGGEA